MATLPYGGAMDSIHDYTQAEELVEGINQKSRAVHEKTSSCEFSLAERMIRKSRDCSAMNSLI
jgi:hypothetical protein